MAIALFVDGASMFYAQRAQGWHMDYRSIYEHFTAGKQVAGAYYFTASPPSGNVEAVKRYRGFKTALIYIGWSVIDKEVHVITDRETGQIKLKGNLDIELTFRMLSSADTWDEAILFGVDIDYIPIIRHLQNLGKTITCVGRRQMTSLELINAANRFIDLEELRGLIEKRR
jgi:uncharacterized LabA/DUF88 family protein